MDERKSVKFSKNVFKIMIPVLIVVAIGVIWYLKNSNKTPIVKDDNPAFALHVTDSLDIEKLKSYGIPIMIDFGADSCIPCKEMAPVLKELNQELRGKVIIKFVDVWKYQSLAQGYPINLIPTQVFLDKEGKPYTPKDPEASKMKIYSSKDTKKHVFTTHEGGMTKEEILAVFKEMGVE
ncbi:MAG: thioredoxin family protein [Clostridium sp.]|uniref:thioredoxin family protein n=1 Tax=Clostridium sp. TaxID=1506 RepID=UPI003D6CE51F